MEASVINKKIVTLSKEDLARILDELRESPQKASAFFNSCEFHADLMQNNFLLAFSGGINTLEQCKLANKIAYRNIHKGTPYYWIAFSAFMIHNYEAATYFFSAAAEEDIRVLRKEHMLAKSIKSSDLPPALLFMTINSKNPKQAAWELTKQLRQDLLYFIEAYNRLENESPYSIEELQEQYLIKAITSRNKNLRSCTSALISFILEMDYINTLLSLKPQTGSSNLFFLHLFKGCLVFETLLKENPMKHPSQTDDSLTKVLGVLFPELGLPEKPKINSENFNDVINDINHFNKSSYQAISITGKIRNTLGHSLGWKCNISPNQYSKACKIIMISCLHTIKKLYQSSVK